MTNRFPTAEERWPRQGTVADIKKERIKNLSLSIDTTSEVNEVNFKKAKYLKFLVSFRISEL